MSEINRNMRKMFTEKQIEEIAKSSVSGGTKLYSHDIIFEDDENNEIELIIISTATDEYDSPDAISKNCILSLNASFEIENAEYYPISLCMSSQGLSLLAFNFELQTLSAISLETIVSDSLSEL